MAAFVASVPGMLRSSRFRPFVVVAALVGAGVGPGALAPSPAAAQQVLYANPAVSPQPYVGDVGHHEVIGQHPVPYGGQPVPQSYAMPPTVGIPQMASGPGGLIVDGSLPPELALPPEVAAPTLPVPGEATDSVPVGSGGVAGSNGPNLVPQPYGAAPGAMSSPGGPSYAPPQMQLQSTSPYAAGTFPVERSVGSRVPSYPSAPSYPSVPSGDPLPAESDLPALPPSGRSTFPSPAAAGPTAYASPTTNASRTATRPPARPTWQIPSAAKVWMSAHRFR